MAKYTDEQIKAELKRALEIGDAPIGMHWGCSLNKQLVSDTLDLIKRQEAEIEELKETLNATIAWQETLQKYLAEKEAEIERLKEYEEIRPVGCPNCSRGNFSNSKFCSHCGTQLQGKKKDIDRELAELASEVKLLKDSNKNLQELYYTEREKVKKAKQKVINIAKALQSAKSEAIKKYIELLKAEFLKDYKGNDDFAYFVFGYIDKVAEMVGGTDA